jgi:hypothetical protein
VYRQAIESQDKSQNDYFHAALLIIIVNFHP